MLDKSGNIEPGDLINEFRGDFVVRKYLSEDRLVKFNLLASSIDGLRSNLLKIRRTPHI